MDVDGEVGRSEECRQTLEELRSWAWVYGKTPTFHYTCGREGRMKIEKGLIVESGNSALVGTRFDEFVRPEL